MPLIFWIGVCCHSLPVPARAFDPVQSSGPRNRPETVVVKSDMLFYVPFSVTGDVVTVKAGTEVLVKSVRGENLKLAYGRGELTVNAAATDFAERLAGLQQSPAAPPPGMATTQIPKSAGVARAQQSGAAQATNLTPIQAREPSAPSDPAGAEPGGGEPLNSSGSLWLGVFILWAVLVAGGVGVVVALVRRSSASRRESASPPPLPSAVRLEFLRSLQPSRSEIESALNDLDWFQFEKLISAVFRAQGHMVEMRGGANADGGIDLLVGEGAGRVAVQCKHWANWKCAPNVVRELLGSMAHEGFAEGMLVCRSATPAARDLASQACIKVIERDEVVELVRRSLGPEGTMVRRLLFSPDKQCPKCGAPMVPRFTGKGANAGNEFWGCSTYPKCRQTMKA